METTESIILELPQINGNSMDNADISVEHSSNEQYSDVNNQEVKNSTSNQLNSEDTIEVINKVKISPMNPTPLEYSCWSTHPIATAVGAFSVFTSLVMIVGILTVWFTAKTTIEVIKDFFVMKSDLKNSIGAGLKSL